MATETVRLLFLGDATSAVRSTRTLNASLGTTGAIARTARAALLSLAVGGLGVAAKAAGDFDQALNVLQATTDATGREMQQIRRHAIALGRDTKLPATSARDAADAMLELAKGGLTVRESMDAARGVLELSAAAQIENAEAAKIVARALNAFGLEGKEAVRVADVLANAANASTGEISDFSLALQQSSAIAAQLGLSVEETTAALMSLADAGIIGSDAGTSLRVMLTRLNPITDKARDLYKELGINAFDAAGGFVGFRDVIRQFEPIFRRATDQERQYIAQTVFGTDAQRAFNIVLGLGSEKFDEYVKQAGKSGSAHRLAEAQTKGFNGALEALRSSAETLAIAVGSTLTPELEEVARNVAEWAGELAENEELQRELREAVRDAAHAISVFAGAADDAAEAVGGWENALKLLVALSVARWASRALLGVNALTGTAGAAGAGAGLLGAAAATQLLRARLLALLRISPITIAVALRLDPEIRQDFQQTTLGKWLIRVREELDAVFGRLPGWSTREEQARAGASGGAYIPGRGFVGALDALAPGGVRPGTQPDALDRAIGRRGGALPANVLPSQFRSTHPTSGLPGYPAVDVFRTAGTPVGAPEDGVVVRVDRSNEARTSGQVYGAKVYFQGASGAVYFITHIYNPARQGARLKRGDIIGYVSRWSGGAPHVHIGKSTAGTKVVGGTVPPGGGGGRTGGGLGVGADTGGAASDRDGAAAAFQLPLSLRRRIAQAELTGGLRDDVSAYQAAARYVQGRLPRLRGERELDALDLLRTLRDRIRSLKREIADNVAEGLEEARRRAEAQAEKWRQTFTEIASAALQGFEDATARHRTPAEALLAQLLRTDEERSLLDAVEEAEKRLASARAGRGDGGQLDAVRGIVGRYSLADVLDRTQSLLLGGGAAGPGAGLLGELQAALAETAAGAADTADAERDLERARFNLRIFYLRETAEEERQSYEQQRAQLRAHLQAMLNLWGEAFRQGGFTPQEAAGIIGSYAENWPGVEDVTTPRRASRGVITGPIPMQHGGTMLVRRPTLFLAGEAGPEMAHFQPVRGGDGGSLGNVQVNVIVEDGAVDSGRIRSEVISSAGEISARQGTRAAMFRREGRL